VNLPSYLLSLNPPQKEAVLHTEGPLLILAGAGSGKTRVITHRVAHILSCGLAGPEEILCVTFTNKACREMGERIQSLHPLGKFVRVTTFHSFGLYLIRTGQISPYGDPTAMVADEEDTKKIASEVLKDLSLDPALHAPSGILEKIEQLKNLGITPEEVPEEEVYSFRYPWKEIYRRYEEKLRSLRLVDFGNLLLLPVMAMKKDDEIRKRISSQYRYIMVDEYQDTNRVQYELVYLLSSIHRNLAVVGDDDQSIYRWRGADIRNILHFQKDFPDARVIRLEQNYRSTQIILDAAWSVVSKNHNRMPKRLFTEKGGGEKIFLFSFSTPKDEAMGVATMIRRDLENGVPPSEIGVFYRINAQSRVLEEAFRSLEIPYRIIGNIGFYERKEIKDLLSYLRLMVNPYDFYSFERAISFPPQGVGEGTLKKFQTWWEEEKHPPLPTCGDLLPQTLTQTAPGKKLKEFLLTLSHLYESLKTYTPSQFLSYLLEKTSFQLALKKEYGDLHYEDRWENVEELLRSIEEWEETHPDGTLREYLDRISLLAEEQYDKQTVYLMTLHSAKGLEFHHVYIVGMEERLLPHFHASLPEELEEERRLCYVGFTRAKERLTLTFCRLRPQGKGELRPARPSRFLQDIPSGLCKGDTWMIQEKEEEPFFLDLSGYEIGKKYIHPIFGVGTLLAIEPSTSGLRLKVAFPDKIRWILPRYVTLTPAQES